MKQFQYLHAVQHQVIQLSVDLKVEKHDRNKFHAAIRQLEDELAQLRRQVNESSPSSLRVPFTVDAPCSTAFPDQSALNHAQLSKPMLPITLKGASSTTSKSR